MATYWLKIAYFSYHSLIQRRRCLLPRDASAERGYATVSRPSVRDVQVSWSYRLEFFENNFTAELLKASALADTQHGDLVQREHPKN